MMVKRLYIISSHVNDVNLKCKIDWLNLFMFSKFPKEKMTMTLMNKCAYHFILYVKWFKIKALKYDYEAKSFCKLKQFTIYDKYLFYIY